MPTREELLSEDSAKDLAETTVHALDSTIRLAVGFASTQGLQSGSRLLFEEVIAPMVEEILANIVTDVVSLALSVLEVGMDEDPRIQADFAPTYIQHVTDLTTQRLAAIVHSFNEDIAEGGITA